MTSLDFEVHGYVEALCHSPSSLAYYVVTLEATFAGEPPDEAVVERLSALLAAAVRPALDRSGERVKLTLGEIEVATVRPSERDTEASPVASNTHLRDVLHECLSELFVPLHRAYPLMEVSISARLRPLAG